MFAIIVAHKAMVVIGNKSTPTLNAFDHAIGLYTINLKLCTHTHTHKHIHSKLGFALLFEMSTMVVAFAGCVSAIHAYMHVR